MEYYLSAYGNKCWNQYVSFIFIHIDFFIPLLTNFRDNFPFFDNVAQIITKFLLWKYVILQRLSGTFSKRSKCMKYFYIYIYLFLQLLHCLMQINFASENIILPTLLLPCHATSAIFCIFLIFLLVVGQLNFELSFCDKCAVLVYGNLHVVLRFLFFSVIILFAECCRFFRIFTRILLMHFLFAN